MSLLNEINCEYFATDQDKVDAGMLIQTLPISFRRALLIVVITKLEVQ